MYVYINLNRYGDRFGGDKVGRPLIGGSRRPPGGYRGNNGAPFDAGYKPPG